MNRINTFNSHFSLFSGVNKRINAFWEVSKETKNLQKNDHSLKKDTKLFIHGINGCLLLFILYLYVYVYYVFIVFSGSHTTAVAVNLAVNNIIVDHYGVSS